MPKTVSIRMLKHFKAIIWVLKPQQIGVIHELSQHKGSGGAIADVVVNIVDKDAASHVRGVLVSAGSSDSVFLLGAGHARGHEEALAHLHAFLVHQLHLAASGF